MSDYLRIIYTLAWTIGDRAFMVSAACSAVYAAACDRKINIRLRQYSANTQDNQDVMILIEPIAAFSDNYIWLLYDSHSKQAVVVDPGDAEAVECALRDKGLSLSAILITHHHPDHVGGLPALAGSRDELRVFGPAGGHIAQVTDPLADGDHFSVLGTEFVTIAVPGHTLDHLAFLTTAISGAPDLFCGDTLFAGGCGRIFEGTAEMMYNSLSRLEALPANTHVYCAHEYTLSNLAFASAVEPDNPALGERIVNAKALRQMGAPTVPSTLELERATNPFLRCHRPSVKAAAEAHSKTQCRDNLAVFATVRKWKDHF